MSNNKIFSEKTVSEDPFRQFEEWYSEHLAAGAEIPNTMSLGTASADRRVSVRTVLLKEYSKDGFVFYTNYKSKKGAQLTSNPAAALLFYWPESGRQVRIEGVIEKIPEKESEEYFRSRPRESQLASWASKQSSRIPDRLYLEKKYDFYRNKFENGPVEKPQYWGGYILVPEWFEFWQNGDFRLHDRISYLKEKNTWIISRLAP